MRVVTTKIPWDMAQKLDQLSEQDGRSKSWVIRQALSDYLGKVEELDRYIQEGIDAHEDGGLTGQEEVEREIEQWGQK
ncbi:MAG: ribbon-helix-helix protein, CopG family [Halieaceae bacterium]|nr:ribbon-helix-helix protein, CopG family [Halieaceae bacterium]